MINLQFASNENFASAIKTIKVLIRIDRYSSKAFLKKVANYLKKLSKDPSSQIFLLLSARAGTKIFLESLKLSNESQVLIQGFTCETVVLPIKKLGLTHIYVDIEKESLSMDWNDFKKKINKKTKVIILQHSFGMTPINREKIINYALGNDLIVIEDLAHGFHHEIFNDKFSKKTVKLLSFGRSKLLSAVHGGALIVPNNLVNVNLTSIFNKLSSPSLFFVIRALLYKIVSPFIKLTYSIYLGKIVHLFINKLQIFTREISHIEKDGKYDFWLEKKFSNSLAMVLLPALKELNVNISKRKIISTYYCQNFNILYPSLPILRFPLLVLNPKKISQQLKKSGIIVGNWYDQVVAPKGLNLDDVNYKLGTCPVAEGIVKNIINLPTNISIKQAQYIVEKIGEFNVKD